MLSLDYDKQYDTLYLGLDDNSNSYGAEQIDNMNIFRDMSSDKIIGILIFGFGAKYKAHELPQITMPIKIDFESDVIPYLSL